MNHPRAPRYRIKDFEAVFDTPEGFASGSIVDASATGLFVETTHMPRRGQRVVVIPSHRGDARLPLELTGKVIRTDAPSPTVGQDSRGFAMTVELSQGAMEKLHSFLAGYGEPLRASW